MSVQSISNLTNGTATALTLPRQNMNADTSAAPTTRQGRAELVALQESLQPVADGPAGKVAGEIAATKEAQATNRDQLDEAVKAVNDFVNAINNSLEFSIDDDTGITVVKVVDVETKEIIKQFPSEEVLSIAKALDGIKGLLVQQKA